MRRISTDADYLRDGTVTLDADGIPLEWSTKADTDYVDSQDQALGQRITDEKWWRGPLPAGDLNLQSGKILSGWWTVNQYTQPQTNAPSWAIGVFGLEIRSMSSGMTVQTAYLPTGAVWERIQYVKSGGFAWRDWVERGHVDLSNYPTRDVLDGYSTKAELEAATADKPSPGLEHSMRVSDMRKRLGKVSVGGRGAVTIVFDHGTKNFDTMVFPELSSRGMKATLCLNAGTFPTSTNEHGDWEKIKEYSAAGIEIANHGMTHGSVSGYENMLEEFAGGRELIEQNIGEPVDTYVQVGMGSDAFDGYGTGGSIAAYTKGMAGTAILQSHAVAMGTMIPRSGTYPINGEIPQGFNGGTWIDSGSEAAMGGARNMVQRAIDRGDRVIIRCHPQYMGQEGKLTREVLATFLDFLQEKIDSGKLAVLTAREWAIADSTPASSHSGGSTMSGTGFPEGVVEAPLGTVYVDEAVTGGALRWVKTTPAGATGWRVEVGDTGWREIPLLTGTGQAFIRRTERGVTLRLKDIVLEGNYAVHVVSLPTGFRWATPQSFITVSTTGGKTSVWSMYSGSSVSWLRNTTDTYDRPTHPQSGAVTFDTADPWQAIRPGTPA